MTPVNPFILKNKEKMIAFLDELSVSQGVTHCPLLYFFKAYSRVYEIQGQSIITKSLEAFYNSWSLITGGFSVHILYTVEPLFTDTSFLRTVHLVQEDPKSI